ncbi:MAG TPA: guanylate kinase [Thermodesulfobacteriota bacterium]|jgi:guanylate kinase|nr:guanylate kinase [Thermodesulfobacteriota bacterium]
MSLVYEKGLGFRHKMREKGGGLIFIISAPSGAGKSTLVREVIRQLPGLQFSVSFTTRLPRPNEKEGEDYHFVSHSVFQKMVQKNEFLEWAEVLGNRYATPRPDLKKLESEGIDLILDIDTQGAKKVKNEIGQPVLIYVLPPSLKALRERLINRGVDSLEMVKFRLSSAGKDMEEAVGYQYVIVNDSVEKAVEKLKSIIIAERCRRNKHLILEENKRGWEGKDG